jgi:sterol desaturase/sphingolipid hydroxylase (fatty acid hydroxylase superfamily)
MELLDQLLTIDPNYILIGLIVGFFSLEMAMVRPVNFRGKLNHLFHSFLFQLIAIFFGTLVGVMIVSTFEFISQSKIGIFNWVQLPFWLKITLGIFLIDMADYWFHRFDHKIPLLWRFHRVHHSDTTMDASTALRGYPTEFIYFTFGELIISVIFGIDILSMNIFLLILVPALFIQHSSLRFPNWADKLFGWLLMMPNFHKVHHEQNQFFTDSNYGSLFIIWDRFFGTFKIKPVNQIKYGLEEFEGNKKQSFAYLIKSPFIDIKRITDKETPAPNPGQEVPFTRSAT